MNEEEINKKLTGCGKTFRDYGIDMRDETEITCGENGYCSTCMIIQEKVKEALSLQDKETKLMLNGLKTIESATIENLEKQISDLEEELQTARSHYSAYVDMYNELKTEIDKVVKKEVSSKGRNDFHEVKRFVPKAQTDVPKAQETDAG